MYLVSIYFDEKTNQKMQYYINLIMEKTGNSFMVERKVPPHVTIAAFEASSEKEVVAALENVAERFEQGHITWASVGQFFPYVIFLQPVLNKYLHGICEEVFDALVKVEGIQMSPYYQPFQWIPHATIGKKLTREEMKIAFEVLQNHFCIFEGKVVKIGLAKTNPYQEVKTVAF